MRAYFVGQRIQLCPRSISITVRRLRSSGGHQSGYHLTVAGYLDGLPVFLNLAQDFADIRLELAHSYCPHLYSPPAAECSYVVVTFYRILAFLSTHRFYIMLPGSSCRTLCSNPLLPRVHV